MEARAAAESIRAWALESGFDRAGVARLGPVERGRSFLQWLARGDHAEMSWLERRTELRLDPRLILDGARSAVCVALQYAPLAGVTEPAGDLWPRVARYARGRDYHDLMGERLELLAARVRAAFPGVACKPYVDTGPLLERELAAAAGLGAVGKNTQLLHPEAGSWFLLGELLLTLDLGSDAPLADLCGSCSRCLEACPTGALTEAYRLDSRRCISYWTIEHRGAIPLPVRPMLEDWVFGCDICQEVCPWNGTLAEAVERPELTLPEERAELDLAALLQLPPAEYVARFRGSPMKRAKLAGLQRNAAVAMGNRRDPAYVEPLGRALGSGEPSVRAHAAWALGRIGGARGRDHLERALLSERDGEVRAELCRALGRPPLEGAAQRLDG